MTSFMSYFHCGWLRLDDLKGSSEDTDHAGWMDVLSVSHEFSRDCGPAALSDIRLTRRPDRASVDLAMSCLRGRRFEQAEIELRTVINGEPRSAGRIVLGGVVVKGYNFQTDDVASAGLEMVYLGFQSIRLERSIYDWSGEIAEVVASQYDCAVGE
jgi:type VI protein secretion system component Hcp